MNNKEKLNLLTKSSWNSNDIKDYFDIGYRKAIKILKKAQDAKCTSFFSARRVDVDKFLTYAGTSRSREIELQKIGLKLEESFDEKEVLLDQN